MRFDTLDAGASVTFTWAYVLSAGDLLPALNAIRSITIIQPTDTASGTAAVFSANVDGAATLVVFSLALGATTTELGRLSTPSVPAATGGGGLFQMVVDTTRFGSADGYTFKVAATIGGTVVEGSKILKIDNTGPVVTLSLSPVVNAPFVIDNVNTFTATVTYISGPAIARVSFFKDLTFSSTLVATDTAAPWTASVNAVGAMLYSLITIRAVVATADGRQTVATLAGVVNEPNMVPTNIVFTASYAGPTLPENSGAGVVVATMATTDPNAGDTFTYSVAASTIFAVAGNTLVVKAGAVLNFEASPGPYSVVVTSTDQGGLAVSRTFSMTLTNVNEAPTLVTLSSAVVTENAGVNTVVGTFSTSDVDSSSFTYTLTSTASGAFYSSGNVLYVARNIDFEAASTLTIAVTSQDSGGLSVTTNIPISVTNVNEVPALIVISSAKVDVRCQSMS